MKGILDNTIIVFTSDNGAIAGEGFSSNYPLRGQKYMLFEGRSFDNGTMIFI